MLAIPASNELKILTNNSAAPGLNLVPLLAKKINWHNLFVRDNCLNNFQKILIHLLKEGTCPFIIFHFAFVNADFKFLRNKSGFKWCV